MILQYVNNSFKLYTEKKKQIEEKNLDSGSNLIMLESESKNVIYKVKE